MPDIKNLKIDTLIFDMDGTLLDTLDDLKDSVNYALNYLGYREKTKEEIRLAVGSGITKLFERVIPGGLRNPDITECIKKFKEYFPICFWETRPIFKLENAFIIDEDSQLCA